MHVGMSLFSYVLSDTFTVCKFMLCEGFDAVYLDGSSGCEEPICILNGYCIHGIGSGKRGTFVLRQELCPHPNKNKMSKPN